MPDEGAVSKYFVPAYPKICDVVILLMLPVFRKNIEAVLLVD